MGPTTQEMFFFLPPDLLCLVLTDQVRQKNAPAPRGFPLHGKYFFLFFFLSSCGCDALYDLNFCRPLEEAVFFAKLTFYLLLFLLPCFFLCCRRVCAFLLGLVFFFFLFFLRSLRNDVYNQNLVFIDVFRWLFFCQDFLSA